MTRRICPIVALSILGLFSLAPATQADQIKSQAIFQGITWTHAELTTPRLISIDAVTIDTHAPGIAFHTTEPYDATRGLTNFETTSQFATRTGVQVAINGGFFQTVLDGGIPRANINGLAASNGTIYSPFEFGAPSLNVDALNNAAIVTQAPGDMTGYVPTPNVNIFNAVPGNWILVRDGQNVADPSSTDLNPRTAAGITADGKLVLLTLDGRNPGHSLGATPYELADILISIFHVQTAINLDGGGSTTLVFADSAARVVNIPVGGLNGQAGVERPNGGNFGVFALPVPEPGSFVLLGLGGLGIAAFATRRHGG